MGYQTDCIHFSGYKPCGLHNDCSLRCPHKKKAGPKVLIIHLEALGAVLRGTAVLKPILRKYPDAHITWITSPRAAALLENNPHISRLLKNDFAGQQALSVLSFDYAFCIDKSLQAAALLQTPQHVGVAYGFGVDGSGVVVPLNREAQELYEIGLSNVKKFFVNTKPETRLITEALNLEYDRDPYVFCFTEAEKAFEKSERERLGLEDKPLIVGLNTGCSGVIPYKKLTTSAWVQVCNKIFEKQKNATILLLGGPEDTLRNQEIYSQIPGEQKSKVICTPTESGIRHGFIYMNLCHTIMTGDSLGLHMAIALQKWTVSWFGPTCAHEIDFYDRGRALLTRADCAPCWKRECSKVNMCYDQVDLDQFVNMALQPPAKKRPDQRLDRTRPVDAGLIF